MVPSIQDVENALAILSEVDHDSFKDNEIARQRALVKSRALMRRLERPREALVRAIWMEPMAATAIKIGQDIQLFSQLPQEGPGMSLNEVAQITKTEPDFLVRFLYLLDSINMIKATSDNRYLGTAMSKAYTEPGMIGGMTHLFTQVWPCFSNLPVYLRNNGYRNPQDVARGPWQLGLRTDDGFFNWLAKRPVEDEGFHSLMASHKASESSWTHVYPVSVLTNEPPDSDIPLVVDVGGGLGRDLLNLRDALLPQTFRFEVQDVASVVAQGRQLNHSRDVEFRVHNFFDPQPVSGARAYFLHSILHDWPDHLAVKILQNIRAAMKVGYSSLLLCERVVPQERRTQIISTMDILMMGLLCAKERTEIEWIQLLQLAGFQLEKIWKSDDPSMPTVIEALPVEHSQSKI